MIHVFEMWMLVMLGCLLFCCTLMMLGVTIAGFFVVVDFCRTCWDDWRGR